MRSPAQSIAGLPDQRQVLATRLSGVADVQLHFDHGASVVTGKGLLSSGRDELGAPIKPIGVRARYNPKTDAALSTGTSPVYDSGDQSHSDATAASIWRYPHPAESPD